MLSHCKQQAVERRLRQAMPPQTPQACHGIERQRAQAVAALGVLGAEGHLAMVQRQETVGGEGHTMGRAGQGREDVLGLPEGKGTQQNVFTPSFLQSLKSLLNRVVPTS